MTSFNPALATAGGVKCGSCMCFLVRFQRSDAEGRAARRVSWQCNSVFGAWRIGNMGALVGGRKRKSSNSRYGSRSRSCRSQVLDAASLCSTLQSAAPFAQLVADNISTMMFGGATFLQGHLQLGHWILGQHFLPPEFDLSAAPLYVFATVLTLAVGSATYGLINLSDSDDDSNKSSTRAESHESSTENWVLLASETEFYNFVYSRCSSVSLPSQETFPASKGSEAQVVQVTKRLNTSQDDQHFSYQRRCIHTGDEGVISLDWPAHLEMEGAEELDSVLLIVPGTVEGSAAEGVRTLVNKAMRSGYFPVVFNPRGCGSSPVTSSRLFTAADSDDLQLCIEYLECSRPNATIVAIGFGFGANILAKYLGEAANSSRLKAAICVANPFDLDRATTALTQSKEDDNEFTKGFVSVLRENQMLFQSNQKKFDLVKGLAATSLREFDAAISMVSHGVTSLRDFYAYASSGTNLWRVQTPILCIQPEYALLTVPGQDFQQNPFSSLLVSTSRLLSDERNREDLYIFPDFALEWLAAVELALFKGRHPLDGTKAGATSQIRVGQEVPNLEDRALHSKHSISLEAGKPWQGSEELETRYDVLKALSSNESMSGNADDRRSSVRTEDSEDKLFDMPHTSYQVHKADTEEDQSAGVVEASVGHQLNLVGAAQLSERGQNRSHLQDERGPHSKENQEEKQVRKQDDSKQSEEEGESERGQVEQASESIMNVLDVTMPGTLSNEQKKKVIAAVGRGETILNAFQEAVPEDVRGKMFDAVSGAVQARGISSQLVGFGKNFPPPTIPDDVLKTLQEKLSGMSLRPQDASNSSQTPQGGLQVKDKGKQEESQSGASSERGKGLIGDLAGSDQQETNKAGPAPLEQPQGGGVAQSADSAQNLSSPTMPGKEETENQKANQNQQSQGSAEAMDEQQPASGSGGIKDGTSQKADKATESEKQDEHSNASSEPKDAEPLGKENKTADQSPSVNGTGNQQMDHGQRQESANAAGIDTGGKEDGRGKDDSSSSGRSQTGQSDQDVKQDKKPDDDAGHDDARETQERLASGSGQGDAKLGEVTHEPLPDKSTQDSTTSPSVNAFMPSLLPNTSSVDISSILQTFTGFDDSTQMAVTNVFGVVESMLDKLEQENQGDKQQVTKYQRTPESERDAEVSMEDVKQADIPSKSAEKNLKTTIGAISAKGDSVNGNGFCGPRSEDAAIRKRLEAMVEEVNADAIKDVKALSKPDVDQVVLEEDAPNIVNQMVMDALKLELLRRIGQAGLEASGIDLENELEKVAKAVTEAVKSAGASLTSSKVGPDSEMDGKLGVLPAETVVSALCSVLSTTSILKGLIPVGVLIGVVLSALGAWFLIATNDMGQNGQQEDLMDKYSNDSDPNDLDHSDLHTGKVNGQRDKEKRVNDNENHQDPPAHEGTLADLKSNGMVGAIAASLGVVGQEAWMLEDIVQEEASVLDGEGPNETPSIVGEIADKALSVAAPVVPKKEDGEVDQERIVALLADLGQKFAFLRLLGKGALLWGGLRGAMSLTDRVLIFLKMSDRPLHQRLLGFLGLTLLLWAPIFVPLLPSLLEQWASQSTGGVAGFAAVVGLYGAVIILITIWGRRIRGFEKPLTHYGLRITLPSKLIAVGSGFGLGVLLVASVYTVETVLGCVQFSSSALVVPGPTAVKVGIFTANLPSALATTWKFTRLVTQASGVGFAVALVEELLFRSWLQEEIAVDLGFHNAVLISAVAFAIMHWSLPAMPGLFFLSIALAGLRARQKGDLSIPIGLHAGLVGANYVLTVGGFIQYVVGGPDWLTGAHVANPLAGALGVGTVAVLALLVQPRDGKKP